MLAGTQRYQGQTLCDRYPGQPGTRSPVQGEDCECRAASAHQRCPGYQQPCPQRAGCENGGLSCCQPSTASRDQAGPVWAGRPGAGRLAQGACCAAKERLSLALPASSCIAFLSQPVRARHACSQAAGALPHFCGTSRSESPVCIPSRHAVIRQTGSSNPLSCWLTCVHSWEHIRHSAEGWLWRCHRDRQDKAPSTSCHLLQRCCGWLWQHQQRRCTT